MKIKLNVDLQKYKAGDIIDVEADKDNIPTNLYWFRRMKDAKKDNCIEIVGETKSSTPKKKKEEEKVNDDNTI